jgi:hypothetical protein
MCTATEAKMITAERSCTGPSFSIQEHLLRKIVKRFVFKAHRLLYHSTPGSRVIKKRSRCTATEAKMIMAERSCAGPSSFNPFRG